MSWTKSELEVIVNNLKELLIQNGCDCDCSHSYEEHDNGCDRCFACKVNKVITNTRVSS